MDCKWLNGQDLILPNHSQSLREDCDKILAEAKVVPKRILVIQNIEVILQMVAQGMGIGFSRESYAAHFQYSKRPVYFTVGNPIAEKPLYAIYPRQKEVSPAFRRLIEIIGTVVTNVVAQYLSGSKDNV